MRVYDVEPAVISGDEQIPKILDMAAGHVYELIVKHSRGFVQSKISDVPVAIFALTLPNGIKMAAPDFEIETTDLSATIGSAIEVDYLGKPELVSLSAILTTIRSIMILNNMPYPSEYTTYP